MDMKTYDYLMRCGKSFVGMANRVLHEQADLGKLVDQEYQAD